jgi:ribosomal protein L29
MTGAEVKKLSVEELKAETVRLREKLFTLRNQATTEKVEDLSQFRKVRKDIARLLTERSARAKGQKPAAASGGAAKTKKAPAAKKPAAKKAPAKKAAAKA